MNVNIATSVQSVVTGPRIIATAHYDGREFTMHKDIRAGADVGLVRHEVASKLAERLAIQGISVAAVEHVQ